MRVDFYYEMAIPERSTMAGLVGKMLLRFTARQDRFFAKLTKEQKRKFREIENKFAVLTITGPEGGVFYLRYRGNRFEPLNKAPDIPYEKIDKLLLDGDGLNYPSGDEVFFDVIDGELNPRKVISNKYFRANTDKIIYDTEQFASAFEQFLEEMRSVLGKRKR